MGIGYHKYSHLSILFFTYMGVLVDSLEKSQFCEVIYTNRDKVEYNIYFIIYKQIK